MYVIPYVACERACHIFDEHVKPVLLASVTHFHIVAS